MDSSDPRPPSSPEIFTIDQSVSSVIQLMEKYRDNPYMFSKVHNYVCVQLPNIMENICKNHEERQQRIAELTVEQDGFIERFLATYRYFYVPTTEKFVFYDGLHYEIKTEDSILHHILTTITSNERQLMHWKQRTKVYIMKRIKENALYKSVPESDTIQFVLENIHPVLFDTKEDAKYFLTILGDTLLRKKNELVHFIHLKSKPFLRELTNVSLYLFGVNATSSFKHKYYDHEYDRCRMVNINDTVESEHVWGNILQNVSVNLLCVACHYSIRYGSSDEYVLQFNNQDTLEKTVFFLKKTSQDQLVDQFIAEYLQVSLNGTSVLITPSSTPPSVYASATTSNLLMALHQSAHPANNTMRTISWKNMQYLWSHFLSRIGLPTIMFQQDLKNKLTEKLAENYKEDTETFIGVSSKYMPYIRSFIQFWETTIDYDETGEYEMDELCMLYKKWLGIQPKSAMSGGYGMTNALNERQMLDLILYYFPTVEIEKEKYVFQIRSTLWDKQLDIQTALCQMKEYLRDTNDTGIATGYSTSIYDAYVWYCKYYSESSNCSKFSVESQTPLPRGPEDDALSRITDKHPLVSKSYFEKYVLENIDTYVVDDKYLSYEWLTSAE